MARHVPATTRELKVARRDLLNASTVKDSLNALPGFRTGAAFFTFLRANLVLLPTTYTHSAMSSNTSTPLLTPSTSQTLPLPSSSPLSTSEPPPNTPDLPDLSDIPPLETIILTKPEDRILAFKLIADSVAQQRQTASVAVIFHPIFAAIWVLLMAVVYQLLYHDQSDIGIIVCTGGGVTMAMLVTVRGITSGYLTEAEKMTWAWLLNPETGEEDLLVGSKFGDDVIGASILRLERPSGASNKKKTKSGKAGKGKGIIRAWTTELKYRHKGIGTSLLEEVVRVTREKLGKDAEVGFAADHANSKMVLPSVFNGGFKKREQMAIRLLEEVEEGRNKR